jgi:hypothetical protein
MNVEWTEWVLSDAERLKFDTWMAGIMHHGVKGSAANLFKGVSRWEGGLGPTIPP